MTNYTFEQRKMIAEYLEELICSCKANSTHLSICYLKEEVKKLKTITFGDIKNQVGTRVRLPENKDRVYRIIKHRDNSKENLILDEGSSYCWGFNSVKDDVIVEVINETETD